MVNVGGSKNKKNCEMVIVYGRQERVLGPVTDHARRTVTVNPSSPEIKLQAPCVLIFNHESLCSPFPSWSIMYMICPRLDSTVLRLFIRMRLMAN